MKRIGTLFIALMMIFSLAGCGSNEKLSDMTAEEIMTKVQETMTGLESYTGTTTTNMNMSMMGSEMKVVSTSEMTVFNNPLKMRVATTAETTYDGTETTETTVYAENRDGSYFIYTSNEAGEYTVEEKTEDEFNEMMQSLMGMGSGDQYLGMLSSVEKVEELETIDDVECVKITAQLTGEALGDVITATGLEEVFAGVLTTDMFTGLAAADVTYWIDNEKGYIVKCEVEMSDMMSSLIDIVFASMAEQYGDEMEGIDLSSLISISEASSVSTFGDFNAAKKFDMPETTEADTTAETDTTDTTDTADTLDTAADIADDTLDTTETADTAAEATSDTAETVETTETQAQ